MWRPKRAATGVWLSPPPLTTSRHSTSSGLLDPSWGDSWEQSGCRSLQATSDCGPTNGAHSPGGGLWVRTSRPL
eukprot:9639002-Heterocapsa_arctica.AAC.1